MTKMAAHKPFILTGTVHLRYILKYHAVMIHLEIMKHTIVAILSLFIFLTLLPSCRKCYTCQNTCTDCILRDSVGVVLDQQRICSDSTWYKSLKATYEAHGFNCNPAPSNYKDDFCVNTGDATDQYKQYHSGNGRYTCTDN